MSSRENCLVKADVECSAAIDGTHIGLCCYDLESIVEHGSDGVVLAGGVFHACISQYLENSCLFNEVRR